MIINQEHNHIIKLDHSTRSDIFLLKEKHEFDFFLDYHSDYYLKMTMKLSDNLQKKILGLGASERQMLAENFYLSEDTQIALLNDDDENVVSNMIRNNSITENAQKEIFKEDYIHGWDWEIKYFLCRNPGVSYESAMKLASFYENIDIVDDILWYNRKHTDINFQMRIINSAIYFQSSELLALLSRKNYVIDTKIKEEIRKAYEKII
jgi:hypothetical protein